MTSQGRRKHSACLFRMRDNCPFRNLRRNKCCDSRNSVVLTGGQWGASQTQTMVESSVSNSDINTTVSVETFSRPPASLQSVSHLQEEVSGLHKIYRNVRGGQRGTVETQCIECTDGGPNYICHHSMDTDTAPSTARPSYMVSAAAEGSNFSLINQQQRNLSSSDTSMDLDSGVDPETGERAQG